MGKSQGLVVPPDLVTQYQRDGYFILHDIIPPSELEMIRVECTELVRQQDQEMDRQGTDVLNLSRRNSRYFVFLAYKDRPQLGAFIFSERMAAICRATIGDSAMLFWEQFVVKGTDTKGAAFGWHQDSGYCDGPHKPYVNCWVPLDDVNEANGTVYLLSYGKAGTREKVQHQPVPGSNDRVGYFGSEQGEPANCKAGSIVVFSSLVFHRSGANTTPKMRRAYAVQFSPEPVLDPDGSLKGLAEPFLQNGMRVR
ncbi:MAG: phytanoyl-CoA dioxygenase family protein [Bacteroidetes bacterium]|nr:phytanoyl-CoA dioxygenase family protein [Bacteroidota bacterium]